MQPELELRSINQELSIVVHSFLNSSLPALKAVWGDSSESCAASAQLTTAVPAKFPVELILVLSPKGPDEVLPLAPVASMKSAVWAQIEKCTKVLYQVCASHVFFMFRAKCHERMKSANALAQDSHCVVCTLSVNAQVTSPNKVQRWSHKEDLQVLEKPFK